MRVLTCLRPEMNVFRCIRRGRGARDYRKLLSLLATQTVSQTIPYFECMNQQTDDWSRKNYPTCRGLIACRRFQRFSSRSGLKKERKRNRKGRKGTKTCVEQANDRNRRRRRAKDNLFLLSSNIPRINFENQLERFFSTRARPYGERWTTNLPNCLNDITPREESFSFNWKLALCYQN